MILLILIGAFAGLLAVGFWYSCKSNRDLSGCEWEELVAKIEPVSRKSVAAVALEQLEPKANQITLEPPDMWIAVGGMEGLLRMRRNAELLLALASFAGRWNHDEGLIVAERMRRDAVQLRRAVFYVKRDFFLHSVFRIKAKYLPFNVHDAASAYYLLTQRLLALYETSHAGRYPRLAAVI